MAKSAINPQAQAVLDGRREAGMPPLWEQTAQDARAGFAPVKEMIGPGPDVAKVSEILIPGQAGSIPARVYEPVPDSARARTIASQSSTEPIVQPPPW